MGYLPKHIKVARYKWNERVIAHALLAGAHITRVQDSWQVVPTLQGPTYKKQWCITYPDGKMSRTYDSRGEAAATWLLWHFDQNDLWPRYDATL